MNIFFSRILNVLLFSLFVSCTSYRYIDIQVLNPGKLRLPVNISKVHILDHCNIQQKIKLKSNNTIDTLYTNCTLLNNFNITIKQNLEQSPTFKNIPIAIQNTNELNDEIKNISFEERKKHLILSANCSVKLDTSDFEKYSYIFYGNYVLGYLYKVDLLNLGTRVIYNVPTFSDTLIWPRQNQYGQIIPRRISDLFDEVGRIGAENYATWLASYWSTEERVFFYNTNKMMRQAYASFSTNDLEGAITIWKRLFEVGTSQLAALAAYNIALAYEMLDDLDNCETWLTKSFQLKQHRLTNQYLNTIKKRKMDRIKLDQMLNN